MGRETGIAWCDSTFNPWIGCTKVSPGCDHCYAESQDKRWGHSRWGKGAPRQMTSDANWRQPEKWEREAQAADIRLRVFCGSMCDVMDDEAPPRGRERLWELINDTPHLDWLLLTKRPQRYERELPKTFPQKNVWLGTTVEMQEFYKPRFTNLKLAAVSRGLRCFVSYEPALGPLSIRGYGADVPDWLIFGGETGAQRRPMEQQWAEDIKAECEYFGVSFFMKQLSAKTPKQAADLIPAHLLIRQFPNEGQRS